MNLEIDKKCPVCNSLLEQLGDTEYGFCNICGYDEHHEEVKNEVMYIVEYAFKYLSDACYDNTFCVPNGSIWTYDKVIDFLKENLT